MATLHVRIDDKVKKRVQKILNSLGLDMSTAVNMYFYQIALRNGIPFGIGADGRVPDLAMEQWEREMKETLEHGKSFDSIEDLHTDILGKSYGKR